MNNLSSTILPSHIELDVVQIARIRSQFARVGEDAPSFASDFYARLFVLAPHVRPLFGEDLTAQGRKLIAALAVLVGSLDDPSRLTEPLAQMGRRHLGYGVRGEHFAPVGVALLAALAATLGEDFDVQSEQAWRLAYQTAVRMMQAGMYADAPAGGE